LDIKNLGMPEFKVPEANKANHTNEGKFGSIVNNYIRQVNTDNVGALQSGNDLAIGKTQNISETILAIQKAQASFQLLTGIRNKLVEAYREVSRMQV